ncbi:MAG: ATP-binding protein [Raineya sp.]|jgi:hypothetical protein|nr:ATP-binding protein [Raineya sp.]
MNIEQNLAFLTDIIHERLNTIATGGELLDTFWDINLQEDWNVYCLDHNEIFITNLVIASHICPYIYNKFSDFEQYIHSQELGFITNPTTKTIHPSIRTALFLLVGRDLNKQIEFGVKYFSDTSSLIHKCILSRVSQDFFSHKDALQLHLEFLHEFIYNKPYQYQYSDDFPASLYTTDETWNDLILPDRTTFYLQDIPVWMKHYNTIIQDNTYKKFTKGMKFLLHGEPGTGKSVCVALFGRDFGKPVYRVDLSQVVSKWVGETSKNIGKVFDIAKNKDWILFFDEGDALFGKRTENNSANDRYGNQEIAYLLQRMEEHRGIIFMATNKLPNMDKAFVRRFQVRVPFPIPDAHTRYDIWSETFKDFPLEKVNLEYFAANVDNTGASIRAFGRYCKLWMLEKNLQKLRQEDLMELLQTHLEHEGKLWSPNR